MKRSILVIALSALLCGPVLGQSVDSAVVAFEEKVVLARALPLSSVRLTGGPLKQAQDVTAAYLLTLEPDRMLAGFRIRAGLEAKAEGYTGWDAVEGRGLTGHIAGHYLSGISYMYAATGDPRFKERADYMVAELKVVQDRCGNGYLGAMQDREGTDGDAIMQQVSQGDIRADGFDLNGLWVPWYTMHKLYAGLRDAYRYTGNKTALDVEIKFAEWAESIVKPMSHDQVQQMLIAEFGGMNEVFADLYADTGDKRWMELSYRFETEVILDPLKRHRDNLSGIHANTNIPRLIGSADRFGYAGRAEDVTAAGFFWDRVVQHHTFATGGNSIREEFPQTDQLGAAMGERGNETCNIYNMRKLTARLFEFEPSGRYADFLERAVFNHLLGSIDLESGATCYMVPVGGQRREYANMERSFTCCHGSGMETHGMHAEGIYYETGNKLWVNLYTPSTLDWQSQGVTLDVETDFPLGQSVTVTLNLSGSKNLTLALRRPFWAGDGFLVKVNGYALSEPEVDTQTKPQESSYVQVTRLWRDGDTIELTLPKSLRLEPTPDMPTRAAIMWGPLVLAPQADDMIPAATPGQGRRGGRAPWAGLPVILGSADSVSDWLKPVSDEPGRFVAAGAGKHVSSPVRTFDLKFVPFYASHQQASYGYVDILTAEEWAQRLVLPLSSRIGANGT